LNCSVCVLQQGNYGAFAARHDQGATTSVPLLGYDLEADRRDGLYRQLVAALVREAGVRQQRDSISPAALATSSVSADLNHDWK